jgi:hypothetical protein
MRQRVVLMENKAGALGAISLAADAGQALIRSFDSRCGIKTTYAYVPAGDANAVVNANARRSTERGWRVFYDGAPNFG